MSTRGFSLLVESQKRRRPGKRGKICFTDPYHGVTSWSSSYRVPHVKLPYPSVSTSCSKVQFRHE
jgi:hypothetical protein